MARGCGLECCSLHSKNTINEKAKSKYLIKSTSLKKLRAMPLAYVMEPYKRYSVGLHARYHWSAPLVATINNINTQFRQAAGLDSANATKMPSLCTTNLLILVVSCEMQRRISK